MSKYNLKKLQIDNKMSALSRMDYMIQQKKGNTLNDSNTGLSQSTTAIKQDMITLRKKVFNSLLGFYLFLEGGIFNFDSFSLKFLTPGHMEVLQKKDRQEINHVIEINCTRKNRKEYYTCIKAKNS